MITRKNEQAQSDRENMRGGNKSVHFTDLTAKLPDSCRVFSVLTLRPGASIGYHVHENETELFYFLEGTAKFTDDDQVFEVYAGDATATFSGHGHSVENVGDVDLKLLACIIKD